MPWGVARLPAPRQGPPAQRLGSTRERLPSSWSEPPALSGSLGVGGAPPARGTATNSRDALPSLRRDRTALVTGTIPSFSESPQPQGSWAKCHRHAALATPATRGGGGMSRLCTRDPAIGGVPVGLPQATGFVGSQEKLRSSSPLLAEMRITVIIPIIARPRGWRPPWGTVTSVISEERNILEIEELPRLLAAGEETGRKQTLPPGPSAVASAPVQLGPGGLPVQGFPLGPSSHQ